MLKTLASILKIFALYFCLSLGCFLMLRLITGYTAFRDDVQFLLYKKPYLHDPVWKTAFYIHVFSAVIALCAGFTQFSKSFFRDHRNLHRLIGRLYVWDILLINFPTGMILALNANGLLPGRTAFVLLDCLWFYFTYQAFISARNKNFPRHQNYMIRSYALTFSAVTLRTWKIILTQCCTIDPLHMYMIQAWIGFIPNMITAELIIRYRTKPRSGVV